MLRGRLPSTGQVDAAEIALRRVSEEESGRPVLAGGWSRKQLLGHLIESASNNHQRFVRAALADAQEFPAYDTPGSVRVEAVESAGWTMLGDLWASYNRYLVHVIHHLPAAKLDVVCRIGGECAGFAGIPGGGLCAAPGAPPGSDRRGDGAVTALLLSRSRKLAVAVEMGGRPGPESRSMPPASRQAPQAHRWHCAQSHAGWFEQAG